MKVKDHATLRDIAAFKEQCKHFLINVLNKLLEKTPIRFGFVRSVRVFDPKEMVTLSLNTCTTLMHNIICYLISLKVITTKYGDMVRNQFSDFMQYDVKLKREKVLCFNKFADWLDHFLFHGEIGLEKYPELAGVANIILTLSHGKASVARGFSERNIIIKDNQSTKSMVSMRVVKDHMRANSLKPETVKIDNPLICSVKSSRKAYEEDLQESAKLKEISDKEVQKNLVDPDISTVKSNIQALIEMLTPVSSKLRTMV